MKAIIPVAGVGTRLRPHTYTQPKALIPVGGKTILAFIIDELLEAGVTEFIFVIGYLGEKIEEFVNKQYPTLQASFVEQKNREGLGHAIFMTKHLVQPNDEIIIVLGDTILDIDMKDYLKSGLNSLGIKKVDDPRRFGLAEMDDDGIITKVVEKPSIPKSNMALVGLYKFHQSTELFDALQYNIENNIRTKDEFHLTDAIERMISLGTKFTGYKINNWFDCGKKDVLLETNAILLKKTNPIINIENFPTTIFIAPVSVGANCKIENAIIGPNVAIGEGTTITNAVVSNSILGDFSSVMLVVLNNSVIGSDAYIKGMSHNLNIGDNTEIDL
jgi:glucose-1-phosphate thymidylyltransferase